MHVEKTNNFFILLKFHLFYFPEKDTEIFPKLLEWPRLQ